MQDEQELIASFNRMWKLFPGMVRLINRKHEIIAANDIAISKGFVPGAICAEVITPTAHCGCLLAKTLKTGKGCWDQPNNHLLRGWLPVEGRDDMVVHFSITFPNPKEGE